MHQQWKQIQLVSRASPGRRRIPALSFTSPINQPIPRTPRRSAPPTQTRGPSPCLYARSRPGQSGNACLLPAAPSRMQHRCIVSRDMGRGPAHKHHATGSSFNSDEYKLPTPNAHSTGQSTKHDRHFLAIQHCPRRVSSMSSVWQVRRQSEMVQCRHRLAACTGPRVMRPCNQSLRAGDSSADLERDPGGEAEYALGDLRRGGDPSLSGGGDLFS